MYYIIDKDRRCYDKSVSDTYGSQTTVDCSLDLRYPSNVVEIRDVKIRCARGGEKRGKVFTDNRTAQKLQLNTFKTLPHAIF